MKNFKCTLLDQGIHIQGDAQDLNGKEYPVSLLLSLEQEDLPWEKAGEWAKEKGGALPTRAQWQGIHVHRDEINAALKEAGKKPLVGGIWTGEELLSDPRFAWCVHLSNGRTTYGYKRHTLHVRAVSAFTAE